MYPQNLVIDVKIRNEIEVLLNEHAWLIDNHKCETIADLYTADGKMVGAGHDTVGRAALTEWGINRAKMGKRQARHVLGNMRLVSIGPKLMRGTTIVTLYRYDGADAGKPEAVAIADLHDTYELCDDGRWRIKVRDIKTIFESDTLKAQLAAAK